MLLLCNWRKKNLAEREGLHCLDRDHFFQKLSGDRAAPSYLSPFPCVPPGTGGGSCAPSPRRNCWFCIWGLALVCWGGDCAIFAKYEVHKADDVCCVHSFFATCLCGAREQPGQAARAVRCCGLLHKTCFIPLVLPWLLLSLQDDFSVASGGK